MRKSYMKTFKKDWKLGAAVGTALSLGSAGAIAGPHGFDLHNVFHLILKIPLNALVVVFSFSFQ